MIEGTETHTNSPISALQLIMSLVLVALINSDPDHAENDCTSTGYIVVNAYEL